DMHVAYREGARHALTKGAAGLAILAGREGRVSPSYQTSRDQLQDGAQGIAAAVRGLSWLEASVGVVTFMPLDVDTVAPRVVEAAGELRDSLL
ncbi:MAG: IclR family transcriptional regulator, partial [Micromonosporaceae bacterium]